MNTLVLLILAFMWFGFVYAHRRTVKWSQSVEERLTALGAPKFGHVEDGDAPDRGGTVAALIRLLTKERR